MPKTFLIGFLAICLVSAMPSLAETVTTEHGGDTYVSGETITQSLDADGDIFAAGRSVTMLGSTEGDFHAAGFDVVIDTEVGEDAYAAGATVTVRRPIGDDLSAAAATLRIETSAQIGGNARLAGATVHVGGPIEGAVSIIARDLVLNAPVAGDVRVVAESITFGPEASIGGRLTYTTEREIPVPERVATAERVIYRPFTDGAIWEEWREWEGTPDMPVFPSAASVFFGFLVTLLFYVALGAIALTLVPKRVSALRKSIAAQPGRTLLLGVIGLSILFGLVPITALTIVGIPFVPIALLGILVIWILAYALGAYAVAMWVWVSFARRDDPPTVVRLGVLAGAIVAVALLNFIPFVGWVANYTLVLLGVGAMTRGVFMAMMPGPALDVDMRPAEDA